MAIQISDAFMAVEANGAVIATARFSQYAAADGNGAWIVSTHPARLFSRSQAITALSLAERLAEAAGLAGSRRSTHRCRPGPRTG